MSISSLGFDTLFRKTGTCGVSESPELCRNRPEAKLLLLAGCSRMSSSGRRGENGTDSLSRSSKTSNGCRDNVNESSSPSNSGGSGGSGMRSGAFTGGLTLLSLIPGDVTSSMSRGCLNSRTPPPTKECSSGDWPLNGVPRSRANSAISVATFRTLVAACSSESARRSTEIARIKDRSSWRASTNESAFASAFSSGSPLRRTGACVSLPLLGKLARLLLDASTLREVFSRS
mmetsp:Transcript_73393/g.116201  ORF Transcript_73393/g.116201 Transcript_73393/m.116201 type:complete len:231 (-) Transcript_73393:259-951(-)